MGESVIVSVEIVVVRDEKVLLITRSDEEEFGAGWVTLPGGELETDGAYPRALELTAQRELKEEVDLYVALDDLQYVESHTFFAGDKPVLDVVLLARNVRGEPKAPDLAEVQDIAWMTKEEIERHPDVPQWTRESVSCAITYVTPTNQ